MDIRKLQKIVINALEDIKGEDIEVINTSKVSSMFDRVVVASGNSNRHVKSLARSVHDKVREAGGEVIGVEGEDTGEWVLVDLGDIVVHVMQPAARAYYNLEELWRVRPPKAAAAAADTPAKPPVKKAAKPAPKPKPAADKTAQPKTRRVKKAA